MIPLLEGILCLYFFSFCSEYYLKYGVSFVCLFIFLQIQTKILKKYFHFEFAHGMDLIYDYDCNNNKSMILACFILDSKFDETIKELILKNIEKTTEFHKLYQVLHHNLLFSYWKKVSKFDPNAHFIFIDKQINEEKEIFQMMSQEYNISFVKDQPKWVFYIIKNFQEQKGACILKFHHTIGDGISLLSFFLKAGEFNNIKFITMKKKAVGIIKMVSIYLTLILTIPYYNLLNVMKFSKKSKIHGFTLSGNKKVFSFQIKQKVLEMKEIFKNYKISINDLFTSCLIECLGKYYQEHFKEELKTAIMYLPVSLRAVPPPEVVCPLNNKMVPMLMKMKILKSNGEGHEKIAKKYSKQLSNMKNSFEPSSFFILIHYSPMLLPNFIFQLTFKFLALKLSFGFTNVPGPINPIMYGEKTFEKIFFYAPTVEKLGIGFSLMSYNNNFIFSVQADEKVKIDPEDFIIKFQNLMDVYVEEARGKNNSVMEISPILKE